jgi:hypothetical protein
MALQIHPQTSGEDHLDGTKTLDDLAWCYKEQGRFKEAEPLLHCIIAPLRDSKQWFKDRYLHSCLICLSMRYNIKANEPKRGIS